MGKVLVWVAIGAVIFAGLRLTQLIERRRRFERERAADRLTRQESILRCDVCGVYVPEGEAIRAGGKVYCSPEHRRDR